MGVNRTQAHIHSHTPGDFRTRCPTQELIFIHPEHDNWLNFAPQARNRGHLNPKWDSDFADVDEDPNEQPSLGGSQNPHDPTTLDAINENQTDEEDEPLLPSHPLLRSVIRQMRQLPPDEDDDDTNSLDEFSRPKTNNLLRWLHKRHPIMDRLQERHGLTTDNSAIARFNKNAARITPQTFEKHHQPESTIRLFNSQFNIGRIFNKMKNGVRIFLNTKSSRNNRQTQETPLMTSIIQSMLEAKIITTTKNGPFISPMFLVTKANGRARPVIDLHHLVKHSNTPKMTLPSLFQLVNRKKWPAGLWYVKIDFKSAFFNIELHKDSIHLFNFFYQGKFYTFLRLPFGAPQSPFFMQRLLNAITKWIRQFTPYTWGHMDDIIIGHTDPHQLQMLSTTLQMKLNIVKWELNYEKSILSPKTTITFLGATWRQTGITRSAKITLQCHQIIATLAHTKRQLSEKQIQRIRGLLNYYIGFAGDFFGLVNSYLKAVKRNKMAIYLHALFHQDHIKFKSNKAIQQPPNYISIATDATKTRIAATTIGKTKRKHGPLTATHNINGNILVNELRAALLGMELAKSIKEPNKANHLHLLIDNQAVIAFINSGRAKWSWTFFQQAKFLILLHNLKLFYVNVTASFIPTAVNPADAPSRAQAPKVAGRTSDAVTLFRV